MNRIAPDAPLACCVCGESDAAPWRSSGDNLLGGGETWRAVRCVRCGTRRQRRSSPRVNPSSSPMSG